MSTAGHPVQGRGCSARTEPPRLLPAGGCYQMAVSLLQSALWGSGYVVCHGFKPHGKQNVSALSMPGHDSPLRDHAPQPWPLATREETRALLLSAFCPRVFLLVVPPPFAGKGKSRRHPSSQCRHCGAVPGGSGEAGGGCSLLAAPLSEAAEGQRLCTMSSLLTKPARALHFLFALATLHSRHFDGKLTTIMSSTMCWALPGPGVRTGEVTVLTVLAVLTLAQTWTCKKEPFCPSCTYIS